MSEEQVQPEEPEGRKKKPVVTQQLVSTLIRMVNGQENPNLKEVAVCLGVSLRTVYRVLQKVRIGELIHKDKVVVPAGVKWR